MRINRASGSPDNSASHGAANDFSLALTGKRFAVFKVPGSDTVPPAITDVNFIFNFVTNFGESSRWEIGWRYAIRAANYVFSRRGNLFGSFAKPGKTVFRFLRPDDR